jgi:hypothetical protein
MNLFPAELLEELLESVTLKLPALYSIFIEPLLSNRVFEMPVTFIAAVVEKRTKEELLVV